MNRSLRATLAGCALALALAAPVSQVAAQGPIAVAQHTEAVAAPPPVQNQLVLSMAAGGTLNAGNTRSYAGNAGGRLGLIRSRHQLTIEALGTIGYSRATPEADVEQTSANVIGRARYDLFLSRNDALFVAMQPRRDTFAGLNLRLQNQVGYLRNLYFPEDAHKLWTELGYDLTYDIFARITTPTTDDITAQVAAADPTLAPAGAVITRTTNISAKPESEVIHSGRIFLGYTNLLFPAANLNVGVETLYDFADSKNVRVNGTAEITTSITGAFKLGLQSRVFFDNVPVVKPDGTSFGKVDAVIAAQLIYTYDSLAGAAAPAPCDCSAAVAEANAACEASKQAAEPMPSEPAAAQVAAEPAPAPVPEPAPLPAPLPAPEAVPAPAPAPTTP